MAHWLVEGLGGTRWFPDYVPIRLLMALPALVNVFFFCRNCDWTAASKWAVVQDAVIAAAGTLSIALAFNPMTPADAADLSHVVAVLFVGNVLGAAVQFLSYQSSRRYSFPARGGIKRIFAAGSLLLASFVLVGTFLHAPGKSSDTNYLQVHNLGRHGLP